MEGLGDVVSELGGAHTKRHGGWSIGLDSACLRGDGRQPSLTGSPLLLCRAQAIGGSLGFLPDPSDRSR